MRKYILILFVFMVGCSAEKTDTELVEQAKIAIDSESYTSAIIRLKNALIQNPSNKEARLLLAKEYLRQGQGAVAEKELSKLVELGVEQAGVKHDMLEAWLLQGEYQKILDVELVSVSDLEGYVLEQSYQAWAYLGKGDVSKSQAILEMVLGLDKANIKALHGMARISMLNDEYEQAMSYLNQIGEGQGRVETILHTKGEILVKQKKIDEAEVAYLAVLEKNPGYLVTHLGLGNLYLVAKKFPEAMKQAEKVLSLTKGNHYVAKTLKGVVLFHQEDYQESLNLFQEVAGQNEEYLPAYYWAALASLALNQYEQSKKNIVRYLASLPNDQQANKIAAIVNLKLNNAEQALTYLERGDPEDQEVMKMLASTYAAKGAFSQSENWLKKALTENQGDNLMRASYAMVLTEGNQPEKALSEMRAALKSDPMLVGEEKNFIRQLIKNAQYKTATQALDDAINRDVEDADLYNLYGGMLLQQGKNNEAIEKFKRALAVQPGYVSAAHNLAVLSLKNGNFEDAREFYQMVLAVNESHIATLFALYSLEQKAGSSLEQKASWLEKVISLRSMNVKAAVLLSREYLSLKRFNDVIKVTQKSFEAFPSDDGLLEVRGLASLKLKEYKKAVDAFEKLVFKHQKSATAHFYLAQAYAGVGDRKLLKDELELVLRLEKRHLAARNTYIKLMISEKNYQQAAKALAIGRKQSPEFTAFLFLEHQLLFSQGKYKESINPLRELENILGLNARVSLNLGRAMWLSGDRVGSIKFLEKQLKAMPGNMGLIMLAGEVYEADGQAEKAIAIYEKALILLPDNPRVMNNLAWALKEKDLSRAFELATKSQSKRPKSPDFIDTLAYLKMLGGDYLAAQKDYQKLLAEEGAAQDVFVAHFVEVLHKIGEIEEMKTRLTSINVEALPAYERGRMLAIENK